MLIYDSAVEHKVPDSYWKWHHMRSCSSGGNSNLTAGCRERWDRQDHYSITFLTECGLSSFGRKELFTTTQVGFQQWVVPSRFLEATKDQLLKGNRAISFSLFLSLRKTTSVPFNGTFGIDVWQWQWRACRGRLVLADIDTRRLNES